MYFQLRYWPCKHPGHFASSLSNTGRSKENSEKGGWILGQETKEIQADVCLHLFCHSTVLLIAGLDFFTSSIAGGDGNTLQRTQCVNFA